VEVARPYISWLIDACKATDAGGLIHHRQRGNPLLAERRLTHRTPLQVK
jgi:hypothetical protein